jgi:predicted PhzF superfamily epimerase YddE/YHI9
MLIPYWASQLNKNELLAQQVSERGGLLGCKLGEDRVYISGRSIIYFDGFITIV